MPEHGSPHPNRRELDMLLTAGERISMSLMSMALSDLGVPAISFTGIQAGVMTDESHSSARILAQLAQLGARFGYFPGFCVA